MRRAALLISFTLTAATAHATERAVITPTMMINCPDIVRDSAEQVTKRTLKKTLRERGYAVEEVPHRGSPEDPAFLTELLSKTHADLVVSVRFAGARKDTVQNDWSVLVTALRRGQEMHTAEDRCEDCIIGKEAQTRMVAALNRALAAAATPQTPPAIAPPPPAAASEQHPPTSTSTTPPTAEPPPAAPIRETPVASPSTTTQPLSTSMTATNPPAAGKGLPHRTRIVLQGVGIGLVALGVGGIAWGAVEAHHNGDQITRNGQIGTFDTSTARDALLSLGILACAGGAAMATVGWVVPERPKRTVQLMPTASPTSVRVQLQWTY